MSKSFDCRLEYGALSRSFVLAKVVKTETQFIRKTITENHAFFRDRITFSRVKCESTLQRRGQGR